MTITEWVEQVHKQALANGWDAAEEGRFPEKLMLVVSELAEALEEYRNHHGFTEVYEKDGKPEGIPIELADAVIRIFDLCGAYDINLEYAIEVKHKFNGTRPYRHGGKKA